MTNRKWTADEIDLLFSDMTNEEISKLTGRTLCAVKDKRYKTTRHYVQKEQWRFGEDKSHVGEARILFLAKQLNVKLRG